MTAGRPPCRALLVLVAVTAQVHAEGRPRYGGTVEGALLSAPVSLDPAAASVHAELVCVDLVFDTLYRVGPEGIVHPHLALALPEVTKDRVRIRLRKDVRFHDGSTLTGQDVVASLERVRTTPARWALAPVSSIRADAEGVELVLKAPAPELAALLALPATAVTKGGKAVGARPVGSGPFAVGAFDPRTRRLQLDAFDGHFAGRPYLDRLVLRWYDAPDAEARQFEKGDAQLSARGAAAFTGAQPKYRAEDVEGPAALLVYIGFGRAHAAVTADRAFRRALDLAIARSALASVGSGERVAPTRTPIPVEAGAAPLAPSARADDLPNAKLALGEAAKRVKALEPSRLGQLKLEILVEDTRPDDREVAERIAYALTKLGIASTITGVSAATLRDRVRRGDTDLWIGQLAAPVTSPTAWWGGAFAAGSDLWVEQRLSAGALDGRAAARAFEERRPIIPLVFRAVRIWHRSDVHGVRFDGSGRPSYADLFLFGDPVRSQGGRP
ncbi:MAG TPA: ABC transporter substrate-binding protein [Kofleriaceae bacterium]|nr:ABC transporter substrate-binding protein [Kofleriaceae bacterium]